MKYKELYDYGVCGLKNAGIEECALDARLLLEHVCHTNRNDLLVHGERDVAEADRDIYLEYIEKRKQHVPLQYITGEQEFMGLVFEVNEHVLIPRQDTEILTEEALRFLHDGMDILDMCTGSGCVLISLLYYSNGCSGVGVDLSQKALEVAEKNAGRLIGRRENAADGADAPLIQWTQSDLFENIKGTYDMIVSNPPYIPAGDISFLMEEVRDYEPLEALDGKEDGLFFYRKIAAEANKFLKNGGYLFFEIGCGQAEDVRRIMEGNGYQDIVVVKDFAGLDRVVHGWKGMERHV